jgi:hypothetical protein
MINTTTIPTELYVFPFFNGLIKWFFYSMGIIQIVIFNISKNNDKVEEEEAEVEEERYSDKYVNEFESLSRRNLTKDEMSLLNTKFVQETMADDNVVIMTYDSEIECFCYYTDKLKDVSYDMLETIARKFVIEYDCKFVCVDIKAAPEIEDDKIDTQPKSVFAKFKKYNSGAKGGTPNFNTQLKIVEQSNHFRFKGKLCDYEEEQMTKMKKMNNNPVLDYANYKILLHEKKTS